MIPNGTRGGSAIDLVEYLGGEGNKNEHRDPHVIGGDQELLMLLPEQSRDLSRQDVQAALARGLEAPRRGGSRSRHPPHLELGRGALHGQDGPDRMPLRRRPSR